MGKPMVIKGGKVPEHERAQRIAEAVAGMNRASPLADGGQVKDGDGLNREPRNRAERRALAKRNTNREDRGSCRHRTTRERRFIDRITLTCTNCGHVDTIERNG